MQSLDLSFPDVLKYQLSVSMTSTVCNIAIPASFITILLACPRAHTSVTCQCARMPVPAQCRHTHQNPLACQCPPNVGTHTKIRLPQNEQVFRFPELRVDFVRDRVHSLFKLQLSPQSTRVSAKRLSIATQRLSWQTSFPLQVEFLTEPLPAAKGARYRRRHSAASAPIPREVF